MLDWVRKGIGGILLVSLFLLCFFKPFQHIVKIPSEITLFEGEKLLVDKTNVMSVMKPTSQQAIKFQDKEQAISLEGQSPGQDSLIFHIAGLPIKKINVNVLKDLRVYPGGQSIGVKLNTKGVLVVGHHLVFTEKERISPGEAAGVQVGDLITKINGKKINDMSEVASYVDKAGKKRENLILTIQRGKETFNTTVLPIFDEKEKAYKLGLYIRDSAAGIGTMTFYEPKTRKYGALGHVISDMDTKQPIIVDKGHIVRSTVTAIEKGKSGSPGEKLARFSAEEEKIGDITINSPFGIFGKLNQDLKNGVIDKPIPVALSHQVKEGPATILTVVNGNKVEEYDIEIVSTTPQKFPATKGMVIKVVDKELLEKTGGIVQGMSGSPIIQDGKLVGAVTHVFVNDPTSGYGVHIEWMLHEAGINIYEDFEEEKAS